MKNTERQSPDAPDVSRSCATWVFLGDEDAAGRTCPHSLSLCWSLPAAVLSLRLNFFVCDSASHLCSATASQVCKC